MSDRTTSITPLTKRTRSTKRNSVTNAFGTFIVAARFDQNIGEWNTRLVTDMSFMFSGASSFDQDLSGWNVERVKNFDGMLDGTGLSPSHYDSLLSSWASQNVQRGIRFDAGRSQYTPGTDVEAARNFLVRDKGWVVCDGGRFRQPPRRSLWRLTSLWRLPFSPYVSLPPLRLSPRLSLCEKEGGFATAPSVAFQTTFCP